VLGAGDGNWREGGAAPDGGAVVLGKGAAAPGGTGPGDVWEPAEGAEPVCAMAPPAQTQKPTANKILCMCASFASATLTGATLPVLASAIWPVRPDECDDLLSERAVFDPVPATGKRAANGARHRHERTLTRLQLVSARAPMRPGGEAAPAPTVQRFGGVLPGLARRALSLTRAARHDGFRDEEFRGGERRAGSHLQKGRGVALRLVVSRPWWC
jgi:hypothetical protein